MKDLGNEYGRFFWSIIIDEKFIGFAWRIGFEDVENAIVFHSSLMLGSFQFTIGFVVKENEE